MAASSQISDTIRLVIADDIPLFREMLVHTLEEEEDIEIIAHASNGLEAVEACRLHRPHIILLDVEMPKMNGVEATKVIRAECPATRVVILTAYEDDQLILELIQAGATGYLVKDTHVDEVVKAIRVAHDGESLIQPRVAQKILKMMVAMPSAGNDVNKEVQEKLERLTAREREVLEGIAKGLNNKELAELFCIGHTTVKTHVNRMMQKLELRDRVEAVLFALEAGLVEK
ncbi:MAG: response regulator transcription factor [Candidatus Eremiobacteraeota bacterium]|nr:response regulator transcription factor [Candidatus Eremiobacteraeota bacterium]